MTLNYIITSVVEKYSESKNSTSLASDIISQIAPELGFEVNIEPKFRYVGQLIAPDGRKFYFRNTNFDLNGVGASEMAKDKDYAAFYMRQMGYPVPEGDAFYSDKWCRVIGSEKDINAAYCYAKQLGFPVIVKPNSRSQGVGVAKVYNKREFVESIRFVFENVKDKVALVQKPVEGDDYRIVVLDDNVISAYRRHPLTVVGDGSKTVLQLAKDTEQKLLSLGRRVSIDLEEIRIRHKLKRNKMSPDYILEDQRAINLLDNSNLSTGGEAEDVTEIIHEDYKRFAVGLTRDMGLRLCGVDLMTTGSINEPIFDPTVIEVNAAPGLDHYAEIGEKQSRIVKDLYKKVLLALIDGK